MSLTVIKPGTLSLLQDLGRIGHQHQGMSPGGPLDESAFLWANLLLDNPPRAAALEITLGGLSLRANAPTRIALTGADLQARLNGQPLQDWCSHAIATGDELQLGMARRGLRAYLAVTGGFTVTPRHGSCATVMREQIGGLHGDGRPLAAGDTLPFAPGEPPLPRCVAPSQIPDYRAPLTLRVLPGYQHAAFSGEALDAFFSAEFRISPRSDRMAYRLEGPRITAPAAGLLSEGISLGAIQVPPDGQPIVLLRDRQTIGGYPKLGCVASLDCSALAQRPPGSVLRFSRTTLEELVAERAAFDQHFGLASEKPAARNQRSRTG